MKRSNYSRRSPGSLLDLADGQSSLNFDPEGFAPVAGLFFLQQNNINMRSLQYF